LIKPEWVRGVETIVEEGNLRERIKKAQEGDERVVKAVEELKSSKSSRRAKESRGKNTEGRRMGNRGQGDTEGGKDIYAGRRTKKGNNMAAPRHSSRRARRKMEDDRVGH